MQDINIHNNPYDCFRLIFTDDYIKHFNITQSKIEKPITKEAIIDYLIGNEVPINTLEKINKLLIKNKR